MRQAKVGTLGQRRAWAGGLLLVGLTAPAVHVGCSSGFSGCQDTRTCNNDPGAEAGAGGEEQSGGASGIGGSLSHEGGAATHAGEGPASAEGGEGGAAVLGELHVVSTTPTVEASDVELDTTIDITFSEPLDSDTVTADSVKILDGETVVEGTLDVADDVITFTPDDELALLADYTIVVTTDVTDIDGVALNEEYAATFETRDGTWHSVELASETFDNAGPRHLPMTATGDTLLFWNTRSVGDHCSATIRWFNRGQKTAAPPLVFNATSTEACASTTAAAHPDGFAAVTLGTYKAGGDEAFNYEFREGKWSAMPRQNSGANALAISPSGVLFNFFPTTTGMAMVTGDGKGAWLPGAPDIAPNTFLWTLPEVAFNANDEGFAVWLVERNEGVESGLDRIIAARYSAASGSWLQAVTLPGSVAPMTGSAYRRGIPAVAVDPAGGAMALWVLRESKELMMNRYVPGEGWSDATPISAGLVVDDVYGAPGLVFDGQTYVAAWTAGPEDSMYLYTSRFDIEESAWPEPELFVATKVSGARPSLGVDGHRNLLMTWVAPTDAGPALFYARYSAKAGDWTDGQPVPDGAVGDSMSIYAPSPLGVNQKGLAALTWGAGVDASAPSTRYYSSFH